MLTFGGASAVKADDNKSDEEKIEARSSLIKRLHDEISGQSNNQIPKVPDSTYVGPPNISDIENDVTAIREYLDSINSFLVGQKNSDKKWKLELTQGIQDRLLDGKDGKDGQNGKDGLPGKDGKDGQDGKDGLPGKDGKDGQDGKDGLPGKDGQDGKDGLPGKDGKDGQPGKPAPKTPEVPQKPDTAPDTPKPPQIPGQSKDVTPAPQNPSNRGLNKPQTQGGNQLAKTPAAHDTHRQLPATGETTNPFFTAAAVAIMTTAGVVAVAKRQENN